MTPLHYATANNHLSVVEYLVNQKAEVYSTKGGKNTPLHIAAENGHFSVVEYLVNHEAEINAKDSGVEFIYIIGLLFIGLPIMVILGLLNILLIKKLILIQKLKKG